MTAETTIPREEATFIAVLRPHRTGDVPKGDPVLMGDGTIVVPLPNGELKVCVGDTLRAEKRDQNGAVVAIHG